jgi:hypothetical protein
VEVYRGQRDADDARTHVEAHDAGAGEVEVVLGGDDGVRGGSRGGEATGEGAAESATLGIADRALLGRGAGTGGSGGVRIRRRSSSLVLALSKRVLRRDKTSQDVRWDRIYFRPDRSKALD